jgi:hypothetical protein
MAATIQWTPLRLAGLREAPRALLPIVAMSAKRSALGIGANVEDEADVPDPDLMRVEVCSLHSPVATTT